MKQEIKLSKFNLQSAVEFYRQEGFIPSGDFLLKELEGAFFCTRCDGTGSIAVQNGPDDVDMEMCDHCWGMGFISKRLDKELNEQIKMDKAYEEAVDQAGEVEYD